MTAFSLLLLVCHVSSAVKHTLKYYTTASSGVENQPEFVIVALVDGVQAAYCDGSNKILEAKQEWGRKVFDSDPQLYQRYSVECFENQPNLFKATISSLKQRFNHSTGVHTFQSVEGCEWDDTTGEVAGSVHYDYNGEDFIVFDVSTLTWVALKPQAFITKMSWDVQRARLKYNQRFITQICPDRLKTYLQHGRSSLLRTDRPSVSLLQKTPSSAVSCHATGFYPDRALMFWSKDGEEIHEGVEHGEILPNHDGTFQMSVDLNVSSAEDWRRYHCVFQFEGAEDRIITELDRRRIKTNWKEKPDHVTIPVVSAVVVLVLVIVMATAGGHHIHQKRREAEVSMELSETSSSSNMN
ncbi:major histocompatibility complex class I-related gene protein-like isoform X1 [Parambassis ranga]|uniref:Major histocompatibility complex class I-related gene protein-like isoform X1 n=1 Tax=Parambassis ranga TaxID=210632 RepID=A0A6P7K217_9TELE|nr:major histocompatibility complex class I-related gene protein-like isoform X1 [Parambassis ranga]